MSNDERILNILEIMQADMSVMKADMSSMKADMSVMQADIQEVKNRIVVIENKHGQSLAALHDGYKLLHDAVEDIRSNTNLQSKLQ